MATTAPTFRGGERLRAEGIECLVACRTDDRCYVAPAQTLSLDEHLIRLLATEGLQAKPIID